MFSALAEFVKSPQMASDVARGITGDVLKGIDLSKVSVGGVSNVQRKPGRREFAISQSEQILMTDWAEDVALRHVNSIEPGHRDIILCGLVVNNKALVTGGKDGQLIVQTLDGQRIAALVGH